MNLPSDDPPHFQIHHFREIGSTNQALLDAHAHEGSALPSGTVYLADYQTAGRGQHGRAWRGLPGEGLQVSIFWRFPHSPPPTAAGPLGGLSLAVGLAVLRCCTRLGVGGVKIKWPNDLLGPHGKLGGILVETASVDGSSHPKPLPVVIGIGLNLHLSAASQAAIGRLVDDLYTLGYRADRRQLLAVLLEQLAHVLDAFAAVGFAPLQAEWEAQHAWAGRSAQLRMGDGHCVAGRLLGIGTDGALRMDCAGAERHFYSGDLTLQADVLSGEDGHSPQLNSETKNASVS